MRIELQKEVLLGNSFCCWYPVLESGYELRTGKLCKAITASTFVLPTVEISQWGKFVESWQNKLDWSAECMPS